GARPGDAVTSRLRLRRERPELSRNWSGPEDLNLRPLGPESAERDASSDARPEMKPGALMKALLRAHPGTRGRVPLPRACAGCMHAIPNHKETQMERPFGHNQLLVRAAPFLAAFLLCTIGNAVTIVVTSDADTLTGCATTGVATGPGGICTLRDAITFSNA